MESNTPLSVPLRSLPDEDELNESQLAVLLSICDAIIPPITNASTIRQTSTSAQDAATVSRWVPPDEAVEAFCADVPSENPAFRSIMRRILFEVLSQADKTLMIRVLSVLSYSAGSIALTGWSSLATQPLEVRQRVLYNWGRSTLGSLRLLQRQLIFLTKQAWTRTSPSISKLLGYPRIPVSCRMGAGHDFEFVQLPPTDASEEPEVLETDVVIVGSGCGGGVAAKTIAEAGLRVLVVDKGHYWAPEYLPIAEEQGPSRLFVDGGVMTDDGSVCIIAGQTWGGGGTINWSASLSPQGMVRREWAASGLPLFTSTKFQESVDRVKSAMGASTEHITNHTRANEILLEGSRRLGWSHAEVPQNTAGTEHSCGHCCMGCRSGQKQGPASYWLPEAHRHGAKFIEGFDVQRVLFKNVNGKKVATGVQGVWESRDEYLGGAKGVARTKRAVVVKASRVIVSAGTLQSPLVLLRSGLSNYNIGRNLYLHPVHMFAGVYEEDLHPWNGPILSSVCSEFDNIDGSGHGVKLETPSMTPYTWLVWLPWKSGPEYKKLVSKMRHTAGFIAVTRDRDTGRVYPDPTDGRCRVAYTPSQYDQRHTMEGLVALARINYVSGAREVFNMTTGMDSFVRRDDVDEATNDANFEEWLVKMRRHGFPSPESLYVSAHQMGTCRMSATPKKGVVDASGQVWGTRGLYVMDASVFPSASGVNPMVTVMAIADTLSRQLVEQWREKEKI